MTKFVWFEPKNRFSSGERCQIGRIGQLSVYWNARQRQGEPPDPEPYSAKVFGIEPKDHRQFATSNEAKAWCERIATLLITQALTEIEWDRDA